MGISRARKAGASGMRQRGSVIRPRNGERIPLPAGGVKLGRTK